MVDSINHSKVEEINQLMEDDFPLLIETFLHDCESKLVDLNTEIKESNAKEICELAHGFKGSSSNMGADKLTEISSTMETMGRVNILADIEESYAELNTEYQLVKEYLISLI